MKNLILGTLLTVSFIYANEAALELEHANKTAPSEESISDDMSEMKAMGKCGSDQKAQKSSQVKNNLSKSEIKDMGKAELELEHANKTAPSEESISDDMSEMKAMGKCGSDQKTQKSTQVKSTLSKSDDTSKIKTTGNAELELEHANKTAPSEESISDDMSEMKAMGKCGSDQKAQKPSQVKSKLSKSDDIKNMGKAELELEHASKLAPSEEEIIPADMSKMKAMGKCGKD